MSVPAYTGVKIEGVEANLNLDVTSDTPLPTKPQPGETWPVDVTGAALTALQALAATVASTRIAVTVAAAVQTALDAIVTATAAVNTSTATTATQTTTTATQTATNGGFLSTLAGAIASGSMKVVLQAGAALIGQVQLAAGAAAIGSVTVSALPSLVLAAGSAAFGKLSANSGVIIGAIEVAASQVIGLSAGANLIGKVDFTTVAPDAAAITGNATPATETPLANHPCTKGAVVCNPAATGTAYILTKTGVSATHHLYRLLPGQSTALLPVDNTNRIYFCSDTVSHVISYSWF